MRNTAPGNSTARNRGPAQERTESSEKETGKPACSRIKVW
jgi:hypothetical protein